MRVWDTALFTKKRGAAFFLLVGIGDDEDGQLPCRGCDYVHVVLVHDAGFQQGAVPGAVAKAVRATFSPGKAWWC